jgi:hypothetical protein
MAFLAAAPAALSIASTVIGGAGALYGGKQEKEAGKEEAERLRKRGIARRAEAGAAAREELRQGRLVKSRAQAVAAAGGGNLSDPSLVNLMGDLEGETQYRALVRMFEGADEAEGLNEVAFAREKEGKALATSSYLRGANSVLSGVAQLKSKYA